MHSRPIVSSLLTLALAASANAEVEDTSSGRSPEPPEAAVIASVPFEAHDETNRIMVDLAPEGSRPFPLMLDTGATYSMLTPNAARALGVSVRRTKSSPYRRATRLDRDLLFWVDTSLSDTRSQAGWDYALLGGNFLEEYVVELDFPNRRVRFLDPDRYSVPESSTAVDEAVVPLKITSRRPHVEIELNGRGVEVLLDTGAP